MHWANEVQRSFQALLCITAGARNTLLLDVAAVMSDLRIPIKNLNAHQAKNNIAIIEAAIEIHGMQQINELIRKLKNIDGVVSVVRRRQ